MEIKATLNKPYTEEERANFIIKQNHRLGYEIKEEPMQLEAWGYTEEEKQEQEKERINALFLTGADVERAIYKDKGIDFDDILEMAKQDPTVDDKALKIEFKANNFYRGNPYVVKLGAMLGYTTEDLDYLFENKTFPETNEE